MPARIPDRFPTVNPGLRIYGGVRRSDIYGNMDEDDDDFQITLAAGGLRVDLSAALPANSTWITLWDGAAGPMLVAAGAFAWGRVKGTGGIWYLEIRNAASEILEIQIPTGVRFELPSGNTYSSAGPLVSAINRLRARVLTGATATNIDGFLVR